MILQFANAIVGFVEERNAGDAVQALKNQLASKCHVCRNGVWATIPGRDLVPGDLIEIKIGDVLPADCILLGKDTVSCDQSALTGESLPVECSPGTRMMMGAAIKRGEAKSIVCGTGRNTAFGEAAKLISGVTHEGRFQKILFQITLVLLIICLVFSTGIFIRLAVNNATDTGRYYNPNESKFIQVISNVVVIFVASIPVAIEVVCTSTLAVGSRRLAEKKIIVARLSAIEELAGMTVLCSDKTGTLTLNQLQLREPSLYGAQSASEISFYSALASKREKGNQDAIDLVITSALTPEEDRRMHAFEEIKFTPFNPTDKRTEAHLIDPVTKAEFLVSKGAPQVILRLCTKDKEALKAKVDADVQMLGDRGFRALGVALSRTVSPPQWEFLGILSLFDPPRPDTKHTIEQAGENGVIVKMVTGDHLVIAKETCRELGMGTNILDPHVLNDKSISQASLNEQIFNAHGVSCGVRSIMVVIAKPRSCALRFCPLHAHISRVLSLVGFAEVMPEHKFAIVQAMRELGHVTGMTGDGVNDAPALKRADIGIAVHGATDAAKAAAAVVLTEPGLSVIIDAIYRSRKIFQRMRNYCIYRISCTLQLLFFFFFAIIAFDPSNDFFYGGPTQTALNPDLEHRSAFVLPVLSLVIITILNDGTMITISHDKVIPEKSPQSWAMTEVTIISIVLSIVACLSSLLLLLALLHSNASYPGGFIGAVFGSEGRDYVVFAEAQTLLYLKISLSDFLTLFSARTRTWFWERRPGYLLGVAALVAMGSSTLLALFWDDIFSSGDVYMAGLRKSKYACVAIWVYCVLWFLVQDVAKVLTYSALNYFQRDELAALEAVGKRAQVSNMYAGVNKGIAHARVVDDEEIAGELKDKVKSLEAEIAALRDVLVRANLIPAAVTKH